MIKLKPKTSTILLTVMVLSSVINHSLAQSFLNPLQNNLSISAGAEYRKTDFRWSIAGNTKGEDPNIYSEIIFNPVQSAGVDIDAHYRFYKRFSLHFQYNRLTTYDGDATDFDYAGDNRTNPTTQLYLQSHKGNMRMAATGFSYDIIDRSVLFIKSGVSYSHTKELYYLLNDDDKELNTTYEAKWKGAKVSLDGYWTTPVNLYLGGAINYELFNYDATANWNLIEDFEHPVSFVQQANGKGWSSRMTLGYRINNHLNIAGDWLYTNHRTGIGLDRLFLKTGERPETQMNGAFKKSSGWRLSATYTF